MFLGLHWYWWLVIVAVVLLSIPVKLKFMQWWSQRRREKNQRGKWGDGQ